MMGYIGNVSRTLCCATLVFLVCTEAYGHRLSLFAAVEGRAVKGHLHFADETPAKEVLITVTGQESRNEIQVATDEQGEFSFEPALWEDYLLEARTQDGHYARFTVYAGELPSALSAPGSAAAGDDGREPHKDAGSRAQASEIERLVEDSVSRQIAPLRRDIAIYRETIRIQDIVGGIGYIVGLAGLWALWKARTRQGKPT
jgi:nickel transport protein